MIDYYTPEDRLGTSLTIKRVSAIAYLRSRGKYILDEGCNWRPTSAKETDVRQTMKEARVEISSERFTLGFPKDFRQQAD